MLTKHGFQHCRIPSVSHVGFSFIAQNVACSSAVNQATVATDLQVPLAISDTQLCGKQLGLVSTYGHVGLYLGTRTRVFVGVEHCQRKMYPSVRTSSQCRTIPHHATARGTDAPGPKIQSLWCVCALHQPCVLNRRSEKCTHPCAVALSPLPPPITQQRDAQMPLDAAYGHNGVYVRCISRACGTVAAQNVPNCSVHLLPTRQDIHTRRCRRRTLSLTCLVLSGLLQGRAARCGGRTAKTAE